MTIRDLAIAKLQQIPESVLLEVNDFLDFVMHKHQSRIADTKQEENISKAWAKWFDEIDQLEIMTDEQNSEYQQLLLHKYRQQGLEL